MATWQSSMLNNPPQTEDVAELRAYLKTTINQLAVMMKELDYVLNGQIDFKNVRAKSIIADRLDVDELSAISANIGEITAGVIRGIEIYGSYIATQDGSYPRAEISFTENLFGAYQNEDNFVKIIASQYGGAPVVYFESTDNVLAISCRDVNSAIDSKKKLILTSYDDILLYPGTGKHVELPTLDSLYFSTSGTLSSILGGIYTQLSSLDARITALGG